MAALRINDVLRSVLPTAPFVGVHRVLWIHTDLARGWDLAVTIEIPVQSAIVPATRYYKAPVREGLHKSPGHVLGADLIA